jgi:hypothetical protein
MRIGSRMERARRMLKREEWKVRFDLSCRGVKENVWWSHKPVNPGPYEDKEKRKRKKESCFSQTFSQAFVGFHSPLDILSSDYLSIPLEKCLFPLVASRIETLAYHRHRQNHITTLHYSSLYKRYQLMTGSTTFLITKLPGSSGVVLELLSRISFLRL